ncbi:hypothetical protein [Lentzea sp. NPDC004782]|uniref:hypothetical protein n=1 Tax=Lentzea sp. NPDC004782 TaxID=3154458 RepID=UPI0033A9CCA8
MSADFLLNTLAVLCWIAWFFFALDVVRCAVDEARGITWTQVHPPGPLQGLAAALIGTVVLALLGSRTSYTATASSTATLTGEPAPIAVVAPLTPGPVSSTTDHLITSTHAVSTLLVDQSAVSPPGTVRVIEEVRLPHGGIYDSLWRIAERVYGPGGGNRWPELFQLNRGVEQQDGHTLTNPNLVRPGWKITAYVPAVPHESSQSKPPSPAPPQNPQRPTSTPSTTQTPEHSAAPDQANDHSHDVDERTESGIEVLPGIFVSLGLAAAVTAAVVSARMWQRRRYRIGSRDRADLSRPIAPVVRALRAAHEANIATDGTIEEFKVLDLAPAAPQTHVATTSMKETGEDAVPLLAKVGVRAGCDLALDLASTRGLGVAGPGAAAAARAILLHLVTERRPGSGTCVLVPRHDLDLILESAEVEHFPSTVRVVGSLDAALDEMEAALLTRTRLVIEAAESHINPAPLVLVASAAPHADRRLQSVLDNGSVLGLAGVLLGQWRPGATVHVRHDGTVSATSPGFGDTLAGTRLFNLPATDATELLAALRDAEGPANPAASERVDPDEQDQASVADTHRSASGPGVSMGDHRSPAVVTQLESTSPYLLEGDSPVTPSRSSRPPDSHSNNVSAAKTEADHTSAHIETSTDIVEAAYRPQQLKQSSEHAVADQPAARRPLHVSVLGRVLLHLDASAGDRELNGALTAKQRELLVYLALHPQGVRREVLNEAVWPDSQPPRPYNSFYNTLSVLRRALSDATDGLISNAILNDDGRYQLDRTLVSVDYWQLQRALHEPRLSSASAQRRLHDVIELYRGDLAEDLLVTWIEPLREATRRDVLDALSTLLRAHGDADQEMTLSLLEHTRKLDRYNEGVYRDIIRTQARLGQYAAIPRTIALLTTTLDEIDQEPSTDTLNLAEFLQRRGGTRQGHSPDNVAAS